MAYRDFDADGFSEDLTAEGAVKTGPTFKLGGQTFAVLPVMPAGAYTMLPQLVTAEDAARFIRRCLVEGDEERFLDALLSKTHVVKFPRLVEVVDWLLDAEGAGLTPFVRPKPEPSPNGASATAATSAASSDEKESTPAP